MTGGPDPTAVGGPAGDAAGVAAGRGGAAGGGWATVVVTGDGPATDTLVATLTGWTRAGLTAPSWWVTPSDWHADPHPDLAPRLDAVHLGPGGAVTVDLLPALAARPLAGLRIVALHLLAEPGGGDPDLAAHARRVAALLKRAAPRVTLLERTALLVPATGVSAVPTALVQPGWEANLVASPEDRIGDGHLDVLVRPDDLVAHAALEVAVAGGLLGGPVPVPDDLPGDGEPHPVVVRTSVRAVRVDRLLDRVLERLQGGLGDRPVPAAVDGTLVAATSPAAVVQRAVVDTLALDGDELGYRAAPDPRPRQPRRLGLWATLKLMGRLVRDLLRHVPDAWVDGLQARAERSVQRHTFGDGTGLEVRSGAGDDVLGGPGARAGLTPPPGRPWTLDELETAARPVVAPGPAAPAFGEGAGLPRRDGVGEAA